MAFIATQIGDLCAVPSNGTHHIQQVEISLFEVFQRCVAWCNNRSSRHLLFSLTSNHNCRLQYRIRMERRHPTCCHRNDFTCFLGAPRTRRLVTEQEAAKPRELHANIASTSAAMLGWS